MATGLADGTAPSTIVRRLGVGFATVGRIAGGTVMTGPTSNTGVDDEERQALQAEGLDPDNPAVIAATDLVRWEFSARHLSVPRYAVDRGVDLGSYLRFPTRRWYKGNY